MTGTEGETSGGGRAGSGMAEARRVICLNVAEGGSNQESQELGARSCHHGPGLDCISPAGH